MDRRPMRSGDRLDAIIRQALEERVAHSQPPAHARHALMGRIRESARPTSTAKSGNSTLHGNMHPVSTVMWAYNTGSGYFRRDSHLSQAITSFTSPMLGLMR
jgi:hypothetical protein